MVLFILHIKAQYNDLIKVCRDLKITTAKTGVATTVY